jgi:mannan endo-1,4-beta-mannosidase
MGHRVLWLVMLLLIAAAGVVYASAAKQRTAMPKGSTFVVTDGTNFTLAGRSFFVTGVNNHYLTYGTDVEMTRVLDDAVHLGANTVRLFLQPVIGSLDDSNPTIWDWKKEGHTSDLAVNGTYFLYWDSKQNRMAINDGPDGLQRVDRVIAEAKERNLKLIIALLDFWGYTGGAQQISAWYIDDDARRPTTPMKPDPVVDWHFFFSDQRTKRDYKQWVKHVLERVNPKTGLQYRADPTIMAWELMNEPATDSDTLRYEWTAEMSAYVKSIDPNHLIGSGANNPKSPIDVMKDLVIWSIDFATWHGYPIHQKVTPAQFDTLIPMYCRNAALFHKPLLLEEFGYARSNPDQIKTYETWLDTLTNDRNCAGWLVWRLVSRQRKDDEFPVDDYDQFDVRNDGGPLWNLLKKQIENTAERRKAAISVSRE